MNKLKKEVDWTILIYANGNNELEPEMHQAMIDIEKVGSNSNVNVVIQIGRAEYKLVRLLRNDACLKDNDRWNGVRRYFVKKGGSELVGNLKKINMADPKQLYHFVKWGMLSYRKSPPFKNESSRGLCIHLYYESRIRGITKGKYIGKAVSL